MKSKDGRIMNASPFKFGFASVALVDVALVMFASITITVHAFCSNVHGQQEGKQVQGGATTEPIFLRQTQSCMGTRWHIALYAEDEVSANAAFEEAWAEIRAIDRCLTNYSSDSELNQFCRSAPHKKFITISNHLATVLHAANDLSQKSDGYFDVTIGPVANLWRRARATHRLPTTERLQQARQRVSWQFIEFGKDPHQVRITKPNVKIDLGGIAKGYAVDQAIKVLQAHGIESALVNGGGDLRAMGTTPEAEGWKVEIAGLERDAPRRDIVLKDAAIATSGDAWQYLEVDDVRYSHLIDPKTGIGCTRRISASVHASTCMRADAVASALTIMPMDEGFALLNTLGDVQALVVQARDDEGESASAVVRKTDAFP